ncbi:MAG: hypothetical protein MI745_14440 [Pseudomonadales bacterium]|nr:hypothetical protein [Pseudomonadales bacterium]
MHFRALALGLCSFTLLSPLHAQEDAPPCGAPVTVPDKPTLEDYPDYSDFLLQIMQYKQASREQATHRQACPQDYREATTASSDPTVIEAPETLKSALARSEQLEPIDYRTHRTWYDRSTSRSFVLPPLAPPTLSSEHIRTLLGNAGSDEPLILPMSVLSLQLEGLNDGGNAQQEEEKVSYDLLANREREADRAAFIADTATPFSGVIVNGNLKLYLDDEQEPFRIEGTAEGRLR